VGAAGFVERRVEPKSPKMEGLEGRVVDEMDEVNEAGRCCWPGWSCGIWDWDCCGWKVLCAKDCWGCPNPPPIPPPMPPPMPPPTPPPMPPMFPPIPPPRPPPMPPPIPPPSPAVLNGLCVVCDEPRPNPEVD